MNTVDISCYLIIKQRFNARGWAEGKPGIRVAKGKPSCDSDEVAIEFNLSLPNSLFVRPSLSASIKIDESKAPMVITPEIQQNIAQVVQDQLGIQLRISAPVEE